MTTIKLRRGTSTEWTTKNPVLAEGEPGLDLSVMQLKLGNGSDDWGTLPFYGGGGGGSTSWGLITGTLSNQTDLQNALNLKADTSSLATVATSGAYADLSGSPTVVSAFTNDAGYTANAGTVTSVSAGTGLTGGPITGSGSLAIANTSVVAGSYTNTDITVDAQGRITSASNGSGGGGAAWGSITGTLSAQTDLQAALDLKADSSSLATVATTGLYSDLTGQPTAVSAFTNDAGYITGLGAFSTTDLSEGTNLYYTEARVSANASVAANTAKNSYPSADSTKLAGIAAGAEVNTINSGDNVSLLTNDAGYTTNTGTVESVTAGTNVTVDNTDPANPIVSATGGGGGGTYSFNRVIGTGTVALTNAAVAIAWNASEDSSGSDVTWSGANPSRLTAVSTGVYRAAGYVAVQSAGQRAQAAAELLIDGVATGLQRGGSYIRNSGSAYDYWTMDVASTPFSLTAGQYVELGVGRVSGATYGYAGSLTINCDRSKSEFWLERVA